MVRLRTFFEMNVRHFYPFFFPRFGLLSKCRTCLFAHFERGLLRISFGIGHPDDLSFHFRYIDASVGN